MADNFDKAKPVIRNDMFGRLDIYSTFDEITEDNVVEELNSALVFHIKNMLQEEFLYWYARGVQPILNRSKDIREDILNIVQVNTAASIVDFKNGYLITQPLTYVSRRKGVQTKVKKLNEYLYRSGKQEVDNKVADWFHRVGKGVCFVEPSDDNEVPFTAYALDPRSAFVVYSLRPGNKPIMAVNFVTQDGVAKFDVFTDLFGGMFGNEVRLVGSDNVKTHFALFDKDEGRFHHRPGKLGGVSLKGSFLLLFFGGVCAFFVFGKADIGQLPDTLFRASAAESGVHVEVEDVVQIRNVEDEFKSLFLSVFRVFDSVVL